MNNDMLAALVKRTHANRAAKGLCIWFLRAEDGKSDIESCVDEAHKVRALAALQRNPAVTVLFY